MKMHIQINSIDYSGSLVNGPGIRTLLFLQGCDKHCEGCHNTSTWDVNKGTMRDTAELADELRTNCKNKKITITGGEPLFQYEALIELLERIKDFDICLYTGSDFDEIPEDVVRYLKYVKVGKYDKSKRCTTVPYIGSTNQQFIKLKE